MDYYDECVYLSVCLCLSVHLLGYLRNHKTKLYQLSVPVDCGPALSWRRCDVYFRFGG